MKKIILIMCLTLFCMACSKQFLPPDMHKFQSKQKIDVEGARVSFKLNKSGDSLFAHIYKQWEEATDEEVKYEITLFDKDRKIIQSRTHQTTKKWNNVNMSLNMIDKSNIGRVHYFSLKLSG